MDRETLCRMAGISPGIPLDATPCCVCGEETKNRCSACGKAGTEIFFCSSEHQKLIWPTHKRVCGSKSTPCQVPLLTRAEAQEAKDNLETVIRLPGGGSMTLADVFLEHRPDFAKESMKTAIDKATVGASVGHELQVMASIVRSLRWLRLEQNGEEDPDPFDCLARFEAEIRSVLSLSPDSYGTLSWQSTLRHKSLTYFALNQLHRSSSPPAALEPWHAPTAKIHLDDYITDKLDRLEGNRVATGVRLAFNNVVPSSSSSFFPPLQGKPDETSDGEEYAKVEDGA